MKSRQIPLSKDMRVYYVFRVFALIGPRTVNNGAAPGFPLYARAMAGIAR